MGNRIKGEHLFLIFALVFGMLLVFLTPPMNAPDENVHFLNAYGISRGNFFGEVVDGRHVREIPAEVDAFEKEYSTRFTGNYDNKMAYKDILVGTEKQESLEGTVWRKDVASPMGYLVSGAGMAVGSLFGNRPYNLLIFGRIANLLFFVAVTFYALKITPCFKRTMLLIAMMPMTLFLAASLSYDAVLIPVTFLFFAIVCRLMRRRDEVIQHGEIAIVLFCVFFLVGVKQAYAPFLLMLLAVPKKKYGSLRNMGVCIGLVAGAAILAYIPHFVFQRISASAVSAEDTAALQGQAEWISGHLLQLPKIFWTTFARANGYVESFWGKLGLLDTALPKPLMVIGLLMIAGMAVFETCSTSCFGSKEWWKRLLPVFAVAVSVVGIMYTMYKVYTPLPSVAATIGGDTVVGFQGRYLIPVFLPFCLAFSNRLASSAARRLKMDSAKCSLIKSRLDGVVWFWAFLCGVFTVLFVFLRYWV